MRDTPAGTTVTVRPPDKARGSNTSNQLNIFLYHTITNASWRNMDMPRQVRPGETGMPPLPLTLFYLLTAYGDNDEDTLGHQVLGRAMSILHDHPVLSPEDIRLALAPDELSLYDLYNQIEGIRITFQPMSLEEMSKLWTTFQTQYRISAAYQVSVILIESTRPTKAPLPVLRQGDQDRGPSAQPDLTPPFPTLSEVLTPDPRFSAVLGDTLTLRGHHLLGEQVEVRFSHPSLATPHMLPPLAGATDRQISIQLPSGAAASAAGRAGVYAVSVAVRNTVDGKLVERVTNEIPLTLAPVIESIAIVPNTIAHDADGNATLTLRLTFTPQARPEQRSTLLIGDREVLPEPPAGDPAPTDTLDFVVRSIRPDEYYVRLRINGVDSILVVRDAAPPRFDDNQKVAIP
jgi:hypothetical protein